MTIAELFVNLGIKGDSDAQKKLKGVQSTLGDIKTDGLAAKAAIVGAVWALERMMSASAKTGADLTLFANATGLSVEKLQRWQYAGRQFSVGAEDVQNSIRGVQDAMIQMQMGKGAPEGLGTLANLVGFDPEKARDTFYMMEKIQEMAQKLPHDVAKGMVKSFGVTDNVFAAMKANAFNPDVMARANIYTDRQANALKQVNVQWLNFHDRVEKAFGNFTAKHGTEMISNLDKLTVAILKVAEALVTVAEKSKVFQLIGMAAEGISLLIDPNRKDGLAGIADYLDNETTMGQTKLGDYEPWYYKNIGSKIEKMIVPEGQTLASMQAMERQQQANVSIQQTLNFQHDGKDSQKTAESTRKGTKAAITEAYRQHPAQKEAN